MAAAYRHLGREGVSCLSHALTAALDGLLGRGIAGIFERIGWAEEEIAKARARHPNAGDRIYHSFMLLTPTQERMETEFVFRSHCRELLDRHRSCCSYLRPPPAPPSTCGTACP